MRNAATEGQLKFKFEAGDKGKTEKAVQDAWGLLDRKHSAEKDEFDAIRKKLSARRQVDVTQARTSDTAMDIPDAHQAQSQGTVAQQPQSSKQQQQARKAVKEREEEEKGIVESEKGEEERKMEGRGGAKGVRGKESEEVVEEAGQQKDEKVDQDVTDWQTVRRKKELRTLPMTQRGKQTERQQESQDSPDTRQGGWAQGVRDQSVTK